MIRLLLALLCLTLALPSRAEEPLQPFLRASLQALPEPDGDGLLPIPQVLERSIEARQPRSGDALLALALDPKSPLQRRATNAFIACWNSMSAAQITAYLRGAIVFDVAARPRYPESFNVYVPCSHKPRFGWGGFPHTGFKLKTSTQSLLDGKPWDKPFPYEGPMGGSYPLQTGDLARGEHTVLMRLEFEFEHKGGRETGVIESGLFRFLIVDSDTPDDLEVVSGVQDEGLVRAFLHISDIEAAPGDQPTWDANMGKQHGMHLPTWNLQPALPFALCFDVEIHDKASGQIVKGDSIFIPAGQTVNSYCFQPYSSRGFLQGRVGLVPVRFVLRPSYQSALSFASVKKFFGGVLEFDAHIKIDGPEPALKPIPLPG